jgi:hypothetical protein
VHGHQRITKAINKRAEMMSSSRALRAGDTFSVKDIKVLPRVKMKHMHTKSDCDLVIHTKAEHQ